MYSGRQTMTSIYQTLQEARQRVQEVEARIQQSNDTLVQLDRSASERYRELARLRVNLLAAGQIVQALDAGEQQVMQLLQARTQALDGVVGKISDSEQQQQTLDKERDQIVAQVDKAGEELDKAEAATQQRLEQDASYRAQLEKSREAERIAVHAEEKAELAEKDRADKGKPYEDDALFSYLWKRAYGTSDYSANPLARLLDGWVARLIGYQDARVNYHMLLEIPARLREHADSVRAAASSEYQALEAIELEAQRQDGIPALQDAVDDKEESLVSLDERIQNQQDSHQRLLEDKAAYIAGEDAYTRQMVELLAAEYQRDDIRALRDDAQRTPLPDDDLVVETLRDIEHRQNQARDSVRQQREALETQQQRARELEHLLADFKRQRYDSMNSTFSDGALLSMMLGQLLNGAINRGSLWREMQRQQRTRPRYSNPRFGTGGLGRGGSIWRGGGLGGGSGGGRGGGLGGGFRTGGGF